MLVYDVSVILAINECATNQHNCHRDAICHDETPFFTCKCKPGYKGNGRNCIGKYNICFLLKYNIQY